jgi:uncharacterized protein
MSISSFLPVVLRGLGIAAFTLMVCACAPQSEVRPTSSAPAPDPAASARALLEAGNYLAAAEAYGTLAAASDDQALKIRHGAMAALAYQDAGEFGQADHVLTMLEDTADHDPAVATAHACSLLEAGLAEHAWEAIGAVDISRLTGYQRGAHARCLGEAALRTQRFPQAASAWVSAYRYPYPAARALAIAEATWRAVAALPEDELAARAADSDRATAGWYALGLIAKRSSFNPDELAAQTTAWNANYPDHPAAGVLESVLERSRMLLEQPRVLALLLPFDATLGAAATAVRDGFLTAWYQDNRIGKRPDVRVYSTAERPVSEVARQAIGEGAELIVGPLRKDFVEALAKDPGVDRTVLALNVIDAPIATRANFFQFGLTPDDEAVAVAGRAVNSGKRALVLAPDTAWGRRLGAAYTDAWSEVGGTMLSAVYYNERAESYAEAIERALNIDLSTARAAALRRHLGIPIQAAPRRRADIELILLAAFPDNARQVMPQLRYFGAADLPVFATSHVFSGSVDAERDRDLDGIIFGDMPWLFGAADRESLHLIRNAWPQRTASFGRLYALGIDAYRVLPYLARMRQQPGLRVPAATGGLSMDSAGVLHRSLLWLRYADGTPRPLDTIAVAPSGVP